MAITWTGATTGTWFTTTAGTWFTTTTNTTGLGRPKPDKEESKMTLTIEEVNNLRPDEAIRLVGTDDDANVWMRRADGYFVQQDGTGVLPGVAFIGYAENGRLVKYDPSDVVPGQLRCQYPADRMATGYYYLILQESATAGNVFVARFLRGEFSDISEQRAAELKTWALATGDERPEWIGKSYGMLRGMIRSGNYNLANEARDGLSGQIIDSLHGVAEKIDNELLDEFLGVLGHPRPGLLAEVTVMLGGMVKMVPQGMPNGVQAKEVDVPWVKQFTYGSLGKDCRCEKPDLSGTEAAALIAGQAPEGAFDIVTEFSCTHDEGQIVAETRPTRKRATARA